MDRLRILDCTLRDGGYITNWYFSEKTMKNIIFHLKNANLDYIECGYFNPNEKEAGKAVFNSLEIIGNLIPKEGKRPIYLAMADCAQVRPGDITAHTGNSIDGIRVVFYKHQVEEAMAVCKAVKENGYMLFVQPMVTIDYSIEEYGELVERIRELSPYAVSIVDSFGYMDKADFRRYFALLDAKLERDVVIGFHSHNNMQLAFITAQDVLDYDTERELMIDASLYGMGRGAGNLNTELIANYYNRTIYDKYDLKEIMDAISEEIAPISVDHKWGYNPYLFLTGLYRCHPNFACFLTEMHEVSVAEFEEFVQFIPDEMKTKCRRPYVEELYQKFVTNRHRKGK